MKDKTDKDLFIGIANSDQKCWVELVRRYANLIYLVSLRILNNDADAEDAMQNVFIKIQKYAHRTNELESAVNWIKTIATREALLILRQKRSQERIKNVMIKKSQETTTDEDKNESHTYLLGLINNLPDKLKTTLFLHYFADMSYGEIGQKMNVDKSTISRWIEKGLGSINQKLKKEGVATSVMVLILSAKGRVQASQVDEKLITKLTQKKFVFNNASNAQLTTFSSAKIVAISSIVALFTALTVGLLYVDKLQDTQPASNVINLSTSTTFFSYCVDNKWGIKTPEGKIIIEAKYEMIDAVQPFREGLCRAKLNGKWGFIDEKGRVVIPFQYDKVNFFTNGVTWVLDEKGWFINTKNEKLFGQPFMAAGTGFHDLIYAIDYNKQPNFLDTKGKTVKTFNSYKHFIGFGADGAALAQKKDDVGIVYSDGSFKPINILKDLDKDMIRMSRFIDGYCRIDLKNRIFIIDLNGDIAIDHIVTKVPHHEFDLQHNITTNMLISFGHYITHMNGQYELRKIPSNDLVKKITSTKKLLSFEMNAKYINLIWAEGDSEILPL